MLRSENKFRMSTGGGSQSTSNAGNNAAVSTMEDSIRVLPIPMLRRDEFHAWLYRIKIHLRGKKLDGVLEIQDETGSAEEVKDNMRKVEAVIVASLPIEYLEYTEECTTPKQMIDSLRKALVPETMGGVLHIRHQLFHLKLQDTE